MVNYNLEIVSTDYDMCDRFYFDEIFFEVRKIYIYYICLLVFMVWVVIIFSYWLIIVFFVLFLDSNGYL